MVFVQRWLAAGVVLGGVMSVAVGQVTTYTDEAEFFAALPAGGVTNSYPDFPFSNYDFAEGPKSYVVGSPYASYTVSTPGGLFGDIFTIGGESVAAIGNYSYSQPVSVDFSGHNIRQVGATFFFSDFFGAAFPGDVVVEFSDGTVAQVPTNTGTSGGPGFFGLSVADSGSAIRSLTIPRYPPGTEVYVNMGPITTAAFDDVALYWSGIGAAPSLGGSGQWTSSGTNWATSDTVIGGWQASRRAVFSTFGGSVSVAAEGVSAGRGIAFDADAYVLDGPGTVTLGGAAAADNDLSVATGSTATVSAPIAAPAGYVKSGGGTLVLTGTATGPVTIARGVLQVGDGGTTGSLTAATVVNDGELEFNRSDDSTFAGGISGTGSLYFTGSGRTTLSGAGTYTGDTGILSTGTLAITSGTPLAGSYRVNTGEAGTFDVSGVAGGYLVPGTQSIAGGGGVVGVGALAGGPNVNTGAGRGTLTINGAVTLGAGGNYNWQVDDAGGVPGQPDTYDLLSIGGPLSIDATSQDPFVINLWSVDANGDTAPALGFDPNVSASYTLATASGGISGFSADRFAVRTEPNNGTEGFTNDLSGGQFRVFQSGNDLQLVFYPAGTGPADVVINVASGTQTQGQAGYPSIDTALSVTKTGAGTLVFDAANLYSGPTTVAAGTLLVAAATGLQSSAVTVDSGATLAVAAGTTMTSPSVIVDGGTLDAAALAIDGLTGIASLAINAGGISGSPAVTISGGGEMALAQDVRVGLSVGGLSVAEESGGGRLDLGAGQVAIAAGGISTADLLADLVAGRNGGGWDGQAGIMSTAAAGSGGTRAVGYLIGGDGSATISFAAPGDTDLSGQVNIIDLVGIDAAGKFGNGQASDWSQGDFNYDGVTNILDLVAIDTAGAFGRGDYFPATPSGGSITAVPEPASWVATVAGLIAAAVSGRLQRNCWRRSA